MKDTSELTECGLTKSLCEEYKKYFYIGTAINAKSISHYKELIDKHFNSLTPENSLKFANIHPELQKYDWEETDELVNYAIVNGKIVRGHTLIWHEQLPDWLNLETKSRKEAIKLMENHITTVVSHYKGKMNCWDVVNEFVDDGSKLYRETGWYNSVGEDYIERALHFAREADPKVDLFLNEYNGNIKTKGEKIYGIISKLKKKGVPIDGIGIQGHYSIFYPKLDDVKKEIERYVKMDLKINITELDISIYSYDDRSGGFEIIPYDRVKRQEEMYYKLFDIYKKYSEYITNVTVWGVADDNSWLDDFPVAGRKDSPLLFDRLLNPKEVLRKIIYLGDRNDDITYK